MVDKARDWTDKKLARMERDISDIYKRSARDVSKKWNDFMAEANEKTKDLQDAYNEARRIGDKDAIALLGKQLESQKKQITFQSDAYQAALDETAYQLSVVNKTALAYVNDQMPSIYTNNFNGLAKEAQDIGINFGIVNEATVKRLITDGDLSLLRKRLDIPKDERWNRKQLNSAVLQGILQGESMQDIAKRIRPITGRNTASAIRNARTMVTCAENQGRLDGCYEMQENGAVIKKVWMATPDSRTREWHLDLDGQEVDLDDKFVDGNGNELDFPGDPNADPETVYNCRCTMTRHVIGIRNEDGSIKYLDDSLHETDTLHNRQIEAEKESRESEEEKAPKEIGTRVVDGKDISMTWERRPDKFDFEIEDVINAQGFDGKPRVVSPEEFDRYVQEANDGKGFIAQRTYSAPDQETLDMYRNQLYEGKWYVDCSTGGAQYGQGMYCAADYSGTLTKGISDEMKHYQLLGMDRTGEISQNDLSLIVKEQKNKANEVLAQYKSGKISKEEGLAEYRRINSMNPSEYLATYMKDSDISGARSYIETFTLDSSAKIIGYDDLVKIHSNYGDNKIVEIIQELDRDDKYKFVLQDNLVGVDDYDESFKEKAMDWWRGMSKEEKDEFNATEKYVLDAWQKEKKNIDKIANMDDGSFAALLGYDAINAEGHGTSGSYTVILNRTKVIFRGE